MTTITEAELLDSLSCLSALTTGIKSPAIQKAADRGLLDLLGLVVALRRRVEVLESRPALKFRGVWSADEDYDEGSFVTSGGNLWIATVQAKGVKPGDGNCWQLAAKKGRDGRHATKVV